MKWPSLKQFGAQSLLFGVYLLGQTYQDLWDHGVGWPRFLIPAAVGWFSASITRLIARLMGPEKENPPQ